MMRFNSVALLSAFALPASLTVTPANAYTYIAYEGNGPGWWQDVYGPINGTPAWLSGLVTLKLVVPIDHPDDPFAYIGLYWGFYENTVTGFRPYDRDRREVTLTFDHQLTSYPTSPEGFTGGTVRQYSHYTGWGGNIENLRVSVVTSDDLLGAIEIGFIPYGVPEPASWAMMIAGFGLAGGVMRRRKTAVAFA